METTKRGCLFDSRALKDYSLHGAAVEAEAVPSLQLPLDEYLLPTCPRSPAVIRAVQIRVARVAPLATQHATAAQIVGAHDPEP